MGCSFTKAGLKMIEIDLCICTFRRDSLADAIRSAAAQALPAGHSQNIIVADNDEAPTAQARVKALGLAVTYIHAPARNISIARNACLDAAKGEWIAFLDDDETAPSDWLAQLLSCAAETGADAVFGPSRAVYPAGTPDWITANDFHSNRPQRRAGTVETGHSCNVVFRRPPQGIRFDPALGRSGGEDTDFFYRLHRAGSRFAICEQAQVTEPVSPSRLSFRWLAERRMAEGQHYAQSVGRSRSVLVAASLAKAAFSAARAFPYATNRPKLAFWTLRALFHLGVVRGAIKPSQREVYGS